MFEDIKQVGYCNHSWGDAYLLQLVNLPSEELVAGGGQAVLGVLEGLEVTDDNRAGHGDKLIVGTWAARAESEVTWDTARALRASDERLEGCAVIYGSEGGGGRCAQHVVGPGPSELRGKLAEEYFPTRDRVAAALGWGAASTCRWRRAPAWRHA